MNSPANSKNENRGYFYRNEKKMQVKQPDYTGKITIEGKEWQLSVWENKDKSGKPYFSVSATDKANFKPKNTAPAASSEKPAPHGQESSPVTGDLDDLFKDDYFPE